MTLNAGNPGSAYHWSDGSSNQRLSVSSSGNYSVTVTNTSGCSSTGSDSVAINVVPVVNLGGTVVQCGGTVTLDAGNIGSTYHWSDGSSNETLTVSNTNIYGVTVTNSFGCTATDNASVNIRPVPAVNLGAPIVQCGGTVTLDAGNAGSFYHWSDGSSIETLTVSSNGNYSVTVTNPYGCTATSGDSVTIHPIPLANLNNRVSQCGGTVMLDAGNAGATYHWSDGSSNETLTISTTGNYSVTVTTAFGCSVADTSTVAIDSIPTVSLGSPVTQCGGEITLDAGNAGSTYRWSNGSSNQTLIISATGNYAVTLTNSFGCSTTGSDSVTINPLPVINFNGSTTQCAGSVTLDAANPGAIYHWSDSSSGQTLIVSSSGYYTVTVVNSFGCSVIDADSVSINPYPVVSLGGPDTQCGGSITLNAGNPGATYRWSSGESTQTITKSTGGTYWVVVTSSGCTTSDTALVTINPLPTINLGVNVTNCQGSVTLDGFNPSSVYHWSTGDTTNSISVDTTGYYGLTVTTALGCTDSGSVHVREVFGSVTLNLGVDTICNDIPQFTLTGGFPAGGTFSGIGIVSNVFDPASVRPGTYDVTYSVYDSASQCQVSAYDTVTIENCAGISNVASLASVDVYPNPNDGNFDLVINGEMDDFTIEILTTDGRKVLALPHEYAYDKYVRHFDLNPVARGVYIIRLTTAHNAILRKLVVQ